MPFVYTLGYNDRQSFASTTTSQFLPVSSCDYSCLPIRSLSCTNTFLLLFPNSNATNYDFTHALLLVEPSSVDPVNKPGSSLLVDHPLLATAGYGPKEQEKVGFLCIFHLAAVMFVVC
eukprot:m.219207 g.219207  ORF g.219207 m.219207 type:complete len:118 (-) comp26280_c0_seq9:129-482(-)